MIAWKYLVDEVGYLVRVQVKETVLMVVRTEHGADAVVRRPVGNSYGRDLKHSVPADPVAGVSAAHLVVERARQLMLTYVRQARSEGRPWKDLADALGCPPGDAVAAFVAVTTPSPGSNGRRFWWECPECLRHVTDHGPQPDRGESVTGHAPGCPRADDSS